jgi:hypothetical protein
LCRGGPWRPRGPPGASRERHKPAGHGARRACGIEKSQDPQRSLNGCKGPSLEDGPDRTPASDFFRAARPAPAAGPPGGPPRLRGPDPRALKGANPPRGRVRARSGRKLLAGPFQVSGSREWFVSWPPRALRASDFPSRRRGHASQPGAGPGRTPQKRFPGGARAARPPLDHAARCRNRALGLVAIR